MRRKSLVQNGRHSFSPTLHCCLLHQRIWLKYLIMEPANMLTHLQIAMFTMLEKFQVRYCKPLIMTRHWRKANLICLIQNEGSRGFYWVSQKHLEWETWGLKPLLLNRNSDVGAEDYSLSWLLLPVRLMVFPYLIAMWRLSSSYKFM